MTSQDLVKWLLLNYGQEFMRPGLDRISQALVTILPKFNKTKIITIAGTNGKGETTLRLSKMLQGHTFAVWTSPHIKRITERFVNELGEIPEEDLRSIIQDCHEIAQGQKLELSFYEFLFFVFCSWASFNPPEYLLLEVGLGGRLDAVNVFDADLVLLPSISRDHQEILGNRLDIILLEKLGVLRKGSTLIHFLEGHYLSERAICIGKTVGAEVIDLKKFSNIPGFEFQLRNEVLATAAFCHLMNKKLTPFQSENSVTSLENRGEVIKLGREWIFFGSHNVDGMRKLIQLLHSGTYNFSRPPFDEVIVAFSKRNLSDLKVMIKMLKASGLGKIVVTVFEHPKAQDAKTMESLSCEEGLEFVQDIGKYVQSKNGSKPILVTGSYYFMGYFKSLLGGR